MGLSEYTFLAFLFLCQHLCPQIILWESSLILKIEKNVKPKLKYLCMTWFWLSRMVVEKSSAIRLGKEMARNMFINTCPADTEK